MSATTRPPVPPFTGDARGRVVSANFFFASSASKAVSARSSTAASSPEGIAWASMSLAKSSFSSVWPPIVSCSL